MRADKISATESEKQTKKKKCNSSKNTECFGFVFMNTYNQSSAMIYLKPRSVQKNFLKGSDAAEIAYLRTEFRLRRIYSNS